MLAVTATRGVNNPYQPTAEGTRIRPERDASLINRLANLVTVYPAIAYHGQPLDWSAAFPTEETGVLVLSNGSDACSVFASTADRVWQGHTIFGPTCRGRRAIYTGKAMIAWMEPHADLIWGVTPVGNRAARWFNRQIGGRAVGFDLYDAEGAVELFHFGSTH